MKKVIRLVTGPSVTVTGQRVTCVGSPLQRDRLAPGDRLLAGAGDGGRQTGRPAEVPLRAGPAHTAGEGGGSDRPAEAPPTRLGRGGRSDRPAEPPPTRRGRGEVRSPC